MEALDMKKQRHRDLMAGINAAMEITGTGTADPGSFTGIHRCADR